ncbi:cyclin-B3-1 isoform X1 [Brachionus plicatilis]|uniref:Cyclin-B3-1 isoform X1 n=1 Tax=Brachionus plicatilis TaxID=10195 RepID=A0A3M7QAW8_BRAPC|nr:cyclin-B3-1 isoform X1 [Brachionus plicatilis]
MDESIYVPDDEDQIIGHFLELETKNVLSRRFLDLASDKIKEKRGIMVNFFVKTKTKFELNQEVLFVMVQIMDRYLVLVPLENVDLVLLMLARCLLHPNLTQQLGWI